MPIIINFLHLAADDLTRERHEEAKDVTIVNDEVSTVITRIRALI